MNAEKCWTIEEVAQYLGVHRQTIWRKRKAGLMPEPVPGLNVPRWPPEVIKQWASGERKTA
jgi:excisionase family DNA binding protein